ncbi:hypothetical protein ACOSQ3_012755 [Xanthoceras sorbifolium]
MPLLCANLSAPPDLCTYFIDRPFTASCYTATFQLAHLSSKVDRNYQCDFGGCSEGQSWFFCTIFTLSAFLRHCVNTPHLVPLPHLPDLCYRSFTSSCYPAIVQLSDLSLKVDRNYQRDFRGCSEVALAFLQHYADTPHLVPLPCLPLAALCLIYAHISLTGHSPPHAILPLFSWLTCLRKSIETINAISEDAPKLREIMTEIKKMMPSIKLIMAKVVESLLWLKETLLNFYYASTLRKPKLSDLSLKVDRNYQRDFRGCSEVALALRLIYTHISLTGHSPPHAILPLFSWLTCLRKSIETINAISEDAPKLREIMAEIKKMMPQIKLIMAKVVESLPWLKETLLNFYYASTLRKPKLSDLSLKVDRNYQRDFRGCSEVALALRLIYAHISLTCHSPPHAILPLFSWLTCLRKSIETINAISEDAPKLREIMAEIKKMMPQIKLIMAKVVESLPWLKETLLNFYYASTLRKPKVVEFLPWLKETLLNFYYASTLRKPKVNHGFFVIFYVIGISVTLPRCSTSSDTSLLAVDGALPDQCTYFIDWSFIASYYPATARLADLSLKVSGSCQCNFGGCYGVARDRG